MMAWGERRSEETGYTSRRAQELRSQEMSVGNNDLPLPWGSSFPGWLVGVASVTENELLYQQPLIH